MTIGELCEILFHWIPTIAQFIVMVCPLILSVIALIVAHSSRQDCLDLKILYAEQNEIIIDELKQIKNKL